MSSFILEIVLVLVLIVVNGVLSMSEIAVVSSRKARLQKRAEEGDRKAATALKLANEPNQLLSTVQIGITLVGILAGAFGGATLAEPLAAWLASFPALAHSSHAIAVGTVVVVITYLSVVIGELVPKRLALSNPEGIASAIARPMRLLSRLASPVERLLSASTDLLIKLLGVQPSEEPAVTEDEIKVLLREGAESGTFEKQEQGMVERVFRLGDRRASGVMTPRTEGVWVDLDDPLEDSLRKMAESGHSFFPVCQGNRDKIVGIASVKCLWGRTVDGKPVDLKGSLLKPLFVPESVPALKLLELFKQAGTHVALVIDEYGGFLGISTLNDVLGAIVGDVTWSDVDDEPQIIQREDGSWLIDGLLPVDEFKDLVQVRQLPGEEGSYQTIAGFVMSQIGRVPHAGDHFEWERLRFEVVDMDERRIDKILVSPLPEPQEEVSAAAEAVS